MNSNTIVSDDFETRLPGLTLALMATPIGQRINDMAKCNAASLLFDLSSGDINSDAAQDLSHGQIYDAVILSNSLEFVVNDKSYALEMYFREIPEDIACEILVDLQATISDAALRAVVIDREKNI